MRAGLSSYTFGWSVGVPGHLPSQPMTPELLLRTAHAWNLKVVQIADNMPLARLSLDEHVALRNLGDELAIDFELGTRGLYLENISAYAELARQYQAKILRIVVDDTDYEPSVETIIGILKESLGELSGTCLAIENHDRLSARTLRGIVEAVASDRVGICLDTANSFGAGEGLDTVLHELAPLTVNLHVKDFAISRVATKMGFLIEGRPTGMGMLNVPELIQTIRRFERCKSAVVELWPPFEGSLPDTIAKEGRWAEDSIRYLKQQLGAP